MSNEYPYRPCPSCGGVEFDNLPDLAFELYSTTTVMGMTALVKVAGGSHVTLVVCSGCGKTDMYTKNVAQIAQRTKGATHFRAAPKPSLT